MAVESGRRAVVNDNAFSGGKGNVMTSKKAMSGSFVRVASLSLPLSLSLFCTQATCAPDPERSTEPAASATESEATIDPAARPPVYLDPRFSPVERAADLVSRMTLAQKAAQLVSSRAPAIPELGVAAYGWWNEALHGVAREQVPATDGGNPVIDINVTSYPSPLSLGSTA